MKKIPIATEPAAIEIGGERMTFLDFLVELTNNAQSFGASFSATRRALKLLDRIEAAKKDNAAEIDLDDVDAKALVEALERPARPWNPRVAIALIPFADHLEKHAK